MRILIYLGHPAHFHLFRNLAEVLLAEGHTVEYATRSKDLLEELLSGSTLQCHRLLPEGRGVGYLPTAWALVKRDWRLARVVANARYDLLVGSDASIAHVGKLFRIPAILFTEDDVHVVPTFAAVAYPFATRIVAPTACDLGPYSHKKVEYPGYQKLAYLHPNWFQPDRSRAERLFDDRERYVLLRFSGLAAHHDGGIEGIGDDLVGRLIELVAVHGRVYISSERPLGDRFRSYQLPIPPQDIHHALYFADLLISDSQSMSVEAAVLGTPSIRYNGFAGKIGVLEELEHRYRLTFGLPPDRPDELLRRARSLLEPPASRELWRERRERMLSEKVDVTRFFLSYIRRLACRRGSLAKSAGSRCPELPNPVLLQGDTPLAE